MNDASAQCWKSRLTSADCISDQAMKAGVEEGERDGGLSGATPVVLVRSPAATSLVRRGFDTGRWGLACGVRIERGSLADYKALSHFHYKGNHPAGVTSVFRMVMDQPSVFARFRGERLSGRLSFSVAGGDLVRQGFDCTVGVLVRCLPHLSCRLRNHALGGRYSNLKLRDAAVSLNREIRTIARVVIDPRFRGLGLAVRLVQNALANPEAGVVFTEALAAMGRVCPFFERAGMTMHQQPLRARVEHARLMDVLEQLGVQPIELAALQSTCAKVAGWTAEKQQWLQHELKRWVRAVERASSTMLDSFEMEDLLRKARDQLLAQPVYFIYRH